MSYSFKYWLLIFLILPFLGKGQHYLELVPLDKEVDFLEKALTFNQEVADSAKVRKEWEAILKQLHSKAYLAASIDSIAVADSLHRAFIYVGKIYEWGRLENGNLDEVFLDQIGFKEKLFQNKPLHFKEILALQDKLLRFAENNGYPFASVRLDSVRVVENRVYAKLFLDKEQLVVLEAINQEGEAKISSSYLGSYLGLRKGDLYDESKIKRISSRIREISFLKETQPPYLTFTEGKATVNLFLDTKKSSQFDLLLGFLPKNTETGKLILTGNAKINLENPFGTGKEIRVEWDQLRPGTQSLDIHFLYPYLLNLPFGVDLNFDLYKRDTSYLDLIWDVGIQYHFEGRNYLKAFWNSKTTNVLNIDTTKVSNTRELPDNLDVVYSSFGLEYRFQQLDYRFNPRKGWETKLRGGAGVKKIRENPQVGDIVGKDPPYDFDFASLYDSLDVKNYQFSFELGGAYYLPITKRTTLKTGLEVGMLFAEKSVYENELYRIGGMRLLRGFDEEAIFASKYAVLSTEFRFMIAENSYLYAFGDYAVVEHKSAANDRIDWPLGFGVGMTFETKAGVFGINYALGRRLGNPIDFGSGKIHFGYVNYF